MSMKLGKLAPKRHDKTLWLPKYLSAPLPVPPSKTYWEYKVKTWPMYLNDQIGCCVFAAGGHMEQNWNAHSGISLTPTDQDVLAAYEAVGGYSPNDPSTDNGAAITDFLAYWQAAGFASRKILGWAAIPLTYLAVRQAIYLFGSVDIGIQVPSSAMSQFSAGMPWDVVDPDGGVEGGHSIPVMGYGSEGMACITWAKIQYMSNDFFTKYCDEAYAVITEDWFNQATQKTPGGFDLAALEADLKAISA